MATKVVGSMEALGDIAFVCCRVEFSPPRLPTKSRTRPLVTSGFTRNDAAAHFVSSFCARQANIRSTISEGRTGFNIVDNIFITKNVKAKCPS